MTCYFFQDLGLFIQIEFVSHSKELLMAGTHILLHDRLYQSFEIDLQVPVHLFCNEVYFIVVHTFSFNWEIR